MKSVYRSPEGKEKILCVYNEVLKCWPDPHERVTVHTSFGNTFVISSGAQSDKAVVLLHGSSTNSAMWMGDAAILGANRRVYAVDIIGEPGNSSENRPDSRGTNYGQWLSEVLDGLGVSRAAIVGNSLGGWMALNFAAYAPERVESLVLIASGGLSPLRASFMFKTLIYHSMGKSGEAKLNKLIYGDIKMPEEVLAFGRLISKNYLPRTVGYGAHTDETFRRLNMPVLYIAGSEDELLPTKKNAARLKKLVPHADIRVLEGRPHVLVCLAEEIAEFINGNEGKK